MSWVILSVCGFFIITAILLMFSNGSGGNRAAGLFDDLGDQDKGKKPLNVNKFHLAPIQWDKRYGNDQNLQSEHLGAVNSLINKPKIGLDEAYSRYKGIGNRIKDSALVESNLAKIAFDKIDQEKNMSQDMAQRWQNLGSSCLNRAEKFYSQNPGHYDEKLGSFIQNLRKR